MPSINVGGVSLTARLLLFDVDGTLVDDVDRYLSLAPKRFAALERMVGRDHASAWARLAGYDPVKGTINMDGPMARAARREDQAIAAAVICLAGVGWHRARAAAEQAYAEADAEQSRSYKAKLFPDVAVFLREAAAEGFRLGVATNGQRSVTVDLLKSLGVQDLFEVVSGSDEVREPKPAPDLLAYAAKLAGVDPSDCVYFGDQRVDAEAAKAAGFKAVVIRGKPSGVQGIREVAVPRL